MLVQHQTLRTLFQQRYARLAREEEIREREDARSSLSGDDYDDEEEEEDFPLDSDLRLECLEFDDEDEDEGSVGGWKKR